VIDISREKDLPMTTSNDNAETSPKETTQSSSSRSSRSSRSKRQTKSDSGIVKADNNQDLIVLSDNTRVVETNTLPNHRPIEISSFEIVGTLPGDRPIAANTFEVATTEILPGHRPVAVSNLPVADLHVLPGDRPIAPNDVVDPPAPVLMGYLD
jgi:hypothetical protein